MQFRGRAAVCGGEVEGKAQKGFKKEMRRGEDRCAASRVARYIVRGVTRILCESTSPLSLSLSIRLPFSFSLRSSVFLFSLYLPSFISFFLASFLPFFLCSAFLSTYIPLSGHLSLLTRKNRNTGYRYVRRVVSRRAG